MNKGQIFLIKSRSRQELADTFMRFQEYYESPVFCGKTFSIKEFADWYKLNHGDFTYAKDWCGFNIPSSVLEPFRYGDFDPLTEKEKQLLNVLGNIKGNFYIIGTTDKDDMCLDTLKHEFAHASFNSNLEYKAEVLSHANDYRTGPIKIALRNMGYHKKVISDEVNAYMLTEPETMEKSFPIRAGVKIRDILDKVFYKYFGYSLIKAESHIILNQIKTIKI